LSFNTLYSDLRCPYCQEKVLSGVGFRFGSIAGIKYNLGETISWAGSVTRPKVRPQAEVVKTIGYFNCDNTHCTSWQDCFPLVQVALVTIDADRIKEVSVWEGEASADGFDIIEPKGLS
jgi:hypothetical protein